MPRSTQRRLIRHCRSAPGRSTVASASAWCGCMTHLASVVMRPLLCLGFPPRLPGCLPLLLLFREQLCTELMETGSSLLCHAAEGYIAQWTLTLQMRNPGVEARGSTRRHEASSVANPSAIPSRCNPMVALRYCQGTCSARSSRSSQIGTGRLLDRSGFEGPSCVVGW